MTEKSEDQVVYLCTECKLVNCRVCTEEQAYILNSKYLALKSDLATAVEALENIHENYKHQSTGDLMNFAKEALGKILEKHETIPER